MGSGSRSRGSSRRHRRLGERGPEFCCPRDAVETHLDEPGAHEGSNCALRPERRSHRQPTTWQTPSTQGSDSGHSSCVLQVAGQVVCSAQPPVTPQRMHTGSSRQRVPDPQPRTSDIAARPIKRRIRSTPRVGTAVVSHEVAFKRTQISAASRTQGSNQYNVPADTPCVLNRPILRTTARSRVWRPCPSAGGAAGEVNVPARKRGTPGSRAQSGPRGVRPFRASSASCTEGVKESRRASNFSNSESPPTPHDPLRPTSLRPNSGRSTATRRTTSNTAKLTP